jgi:signal transduction histidine kinase
MQARGFARRLPAAIAVVLALLLAVLAAVQWRWIGEVNAMERQRMLASLAGAGGRFTEDFDREVTRIFLFFHPEPTERREALARVVRQHRRWQAEAPYPGLIRDVLLMRRGEDGGPEALALRPGRQGFEPCSCAAELARVRRLLHEESELRSGSHGMNVSILGDVPALLIPVGFWPLEIDAAAELSERAYLLVRLDSRVIATEILPELTRRYFDDARGGDYALAVMDLATPGKAVFLSDPATAYSSFRSGDLRQPMFRLRPFEELHSLWPDHGARVHRRHLSREPWTRRGPLPFARSFRDSGAWELVIKHREGSLGQAVAAVRHRNLAISGGILALLAATMGMLMVTTQRAQRLARQQIEFVAGVTHELNTPLTAIRSAGQNLADGVVAEPAQVRRYGTLIANEGRRLSDMVGQALELAGIQSGRRAYHLRPAEPAEIVDGALQDCRWLLEESGVTVEREMEPDLPLLQADAAALRRAVQNLVENAVKYGGRAGWIGVRVRRGGAGQVEITVEDRGPGIRPDDLPHLFEPFFRGRDAAAGGVPGSGLGLSLVRHIVEAHGGRVTVKTGEGSAFTLQLPAAAREAALQAVEEPA